VAVAAVTGGAGVVVASCLPDLESTTVPPVADAAKAVCGNGLIEYEAGEQCDPGDATSPGCDDHCRIECDAGREDDVALPAYVDPQTNHCYFLLSKEAGANPVAGCAAEGAHVITLGSGSELNQVVNFLPAKIPFFWLGLDPTARDGGEQNYESVIDEPGLGRACRGCYGQPLLPRDGGLPRRKGQGDDAGCVSWENDLAPHWYATSCASSLPTVCEREPVGSRAAYPCNATCFTVLATVSASPKRYLWSPTPVPANEAFQICDELNDKGTTASLVVFSVPEEREQVFYELLHLPNTSVPTDFWTGLTSSARDAGGVEWVWDDGRPEGQHPLVWGDHEPKTNQPGARAYALQTGTNYAVHGATYDTQLAHARDPDAGDGGVEMHAVLCQISP
jgi:hypothetical protein